MPSKTLLLVVAVAAVVADEVPDFVIKGKCPAVDEQRLWQQQLPNHSRFGGVWYQQAISTNPYQLLKKCVRIHYDYNGKGFDVKTVGITPEGSQLKRKGVLTPMPLGDPHLMINLENSFPAPLVILDTDYNNYACMYSCMEYNYGYHSDFAFFFARAPESYDKYIAKCRAALDSIGVDPNRLIKTEQGSGCDYEQLTKLIKDEL
ncbi:crustacyanin-C1 subunit-like [Macrobrachium nipponense]|uniref:crustacyanin-C1 subunit-like n=1 Tax=Macrobrachium nipponense TaxID=159736 RepID=UPI0030C8C3D7